MDKKFIWRRRGMKKQYKKPLIAIEHFSIVHTAARDCWDGIPQESVNLSDHPCAWDIGGDIFLFSTSLTGTSCNTDGELMGMGCYNNPEDGKYIFRS